MLIALVSSYPIFQPDNFGIFANFAVIHVADRFLKNVHYFSETQAIATLRRAAM